MSLFQCYTNSICIPDEKEKTAGRILNSDICAIQGYLVDVLRAPSDRPLFKEVVATASAAIESYGKSLTSPSSTFVVIQESVAELAHHLNRNAKDSTKAQELEFPMMRRLMPFPGYSLCVSLYQANDRHLTLELQATGLAIAFAISTGQKVEAPFANSIRRSVTPKLFQESCIEEKSHASWQGSYLKKRAIAAKIFENGINPDPESDCERLFDVHARFELSRKMRYSPPRQRQAVLDRRHQSENQLLRSSKALLTRALGGDQTSLLELVAFSLGLSLSTSMRIPLASPKTNHAWIMVLDIDAGLIKTNLDPLTPNSATPEANAVCFRPANKIIVKPLR